MITYFLNLNFEKYLINNNIIFKKYIIKNKNQSIIILKKIIN